LWRHHALACIYLNIDKEGKERERRHR